MPILTILFFLVVPSFLAWTFARGCRDACASLTEIELVRDARESWSRRVLVGALLAMALTLALS